MSKKAVLDTRAWYSGPSQRGDYSIYQIQLKWGGRKIKYKRRNRWRELLFETLVSWNVEPPEKGVTYKAPRAGELAPPNQLAKICFKGPGRRNPTILEERKIAFPKDEYQDWLYRIIWIIVAKYRKIPIPDLIKNTLSERRLAKLRHMKSVNKFARVNAIFMGAVDGTTSHMADVEYPLGQGRREVVIESGLKGTYNAGLTLGETAGGLRYATGGRSIGEGGGGARIYALDRMLKPLLKENANAPGEYEQTWETCKIAGKLIDATSTEAEDLIHEAKIMGAIGSHENIIKFLDAHYVRNRQGGNPKLYIFMEMGIACLEDSLPRCDLTGEESAFEIKLTGALVRQYARGILNGMSHMHKLNIYHLDMKPGQIVIGSDGQPKILDFGMSRAKVHYANRKEMMKDITPRDGSDFYRGPEAYSGNKYKKLSELELRDAYATGLTILESLIAPVINIKRIAGNMTGISPGANIAPLESKVVQRWNKRIRFTSFKERMIKKGVYETALVAMGMLQNDPSRRVTCTAANTLLALSEPLKLRKAPDIPSPSGDTIW